MNRLRQTKSSLTRKPGRLGLMALFALMFCLPLMAGNWPPLMVDGIHDPNGHGVDLLQEPREALSALPRDTIGNQVDWVKAIEEGKVTPLAKILPDTKVDMLDSEVIMSRTGEMPMVRFPHRAHTRWLACDNCHEELFRTESGATQVNMFKILAGESCGLCHGSVAFPVTECRRCHNVSRVAR